MREAYTEVMEHLSLTEVERACIVRGLRRRARAKQLRRWGGLAACLIVAVALCTVALPQLREPPVQVIPDFVEAANATELSELVGFPVAQAEELPFEVVNTRWTALWHELAETVYTGPDGQTATLRQGQGTDDVSGDCDVYADVQALPFSQGTATLKGDGGRYVLAIWTRDGASFSLALSEGVPAEDWAAILDGIG